MEHPQFENKRINNNYYGSKLNEFVANFCRKDIVVNNIDLIISYYKDPEKPIRIIESKRGREKLSKGQDILLDRLSSECNMSVYVVYGDFPYHQARIYSYQKNKEIVLNQQDFILWLNNKF